MRLMRRDENGSLSLTKDLLGDDEIPPYAILSHTWRADEEVTYDDWIGNRGKSKPGYAKILFCSQQAERDGLRYFWIDTCCINKSDHAQLSEAINSMFRWYQQAVKCYVYLSDVSKMKRKEIDNTAPISWESAFRASRWFTRGWTLQELIAPKIVEFFSAKGERLGDKQSLEQQIQDVTGIAIGALRGESLEGFTVSERLQWAKRRQTMRKEDKAYCLLGIFGIFMPLMYGEGEDHAFKRLHAEISNNLGPIKQYHTLEAARVDSTGILARLPVEQNAAYDSISEKHSPRCFDGTRTEILSAIRTWSESAHSKPIFWLSGMAGTGNSTIARTVSKSFAQEGRLGASFFFKKGEGGRGTVSRFFSTIAMDLVSQEQKLKPALEDAIKDYPNLADRPLQEQFEKLILIPLTTLQRLASHERRLIIVLDALDECEREQDVRTILRLFRRIRGIHCLSLKFIITSQPNAHIRLGYKEMADGTYHDLVLHEVPGCTIKHDIRLFLQAELLSIQQSRNLPSKWPSQSQIIDLLDLTTPFFICAAIVCRYIASRGGNPKTKLNRILQYKNSTFSQMNSTYLPILKQLLAEQDDEQEYWIRTFKDVLGSMTILEHPLAMAALAGLLGRPREDVTYLLESLDSVVSIPENENASVTILHFSFREFLLTSESPQQHQFWIDEKGAHINLVFHCLKLMSASHGLQQDMCGFSKSGMATEDMEEAKIRKRIQPALRYGCLHWVDHLEKSHVKITDNDHIFLFLKTHLLHWLEALSLLKELKQCRRFLLRLQMIVDPKSTYCKKFINDAIRFILHFQSVIADTPLQLYTSLLVFAPETSIVREIFSDVLPNPVKLMSMREKRWEWENSFSHFDDFDVKNEAVTAISPYGDLLASSAINSCTVNIWNTVSGAFEKVLKGHSDYVCALAFGPTGALLVSVSIDCEMRLWELSTGVCRSIIICPYPLTEVLSLSFCGALGLVTRNAVSTWDITRGPSHAILESHHLIKNAIFSPDMKMILLVLRNETAELHDVSTKVRHLLLKGISSGTEQMAFSPDSKLLLSAAGGTKFTLWETESGSCWSTVEGHTANILAVAFSPTGELFASVSEDMTVRVWELATQTCRSAWKHDHKFTRISFSPDEKLILTISTLDTELVVWDVATREHQRLEGYNGTVKHVAVSRDRQRLTAVCDKVTVWGKAAMVVSQERSTHSSGILAVALSKNGQNAATGSEDGTVHLWNTELGSGFKTSKERLAPIHAVAFSPDGDLIAIGTRNGGVYLWEISTDLMRPELQRWTSETSHTVDMVAFSQDGQWLAAVLSTGDSNYQSTVIVWDVKTGQCRKVIQAEYYVERLAFTPEGEVIFSDAACSMLSSWIATKLIWEQRQHRSRFKVLDQWIWRDKKRYLWLPPEYRPRSEAHLSSRVAYKDDLVCIGSVTGRLVCLRLK